MIGRDTIYHLSRITHSRTPAIVILQYNVLRTRSQLIETLEVDFNKHLRKILKVSQTPNKCQAFNGQGGNIDPHNKNTFSIKAINLNRFVDELKSVKTYFDTNETTT